MILLIYDNREFGKLRLMFDIVCITLI